MPRTTASFESQCNDGVAVLHQEYQQLRKEMVENTCGPFQVHVESCSFSVNEIC
jgi:hypothetical protein